MSKTKYVNVNELLSQMIMIIKKIQWFMRKYHLFFPNRKVNPCRRMAKTIRTNNVADKMFVWLLLTVLIRKQ